MSLEHGYLILKTADDVLLAVDLGLEVGLKGSDTDLKGLLSSRQILDLSSQSSEVPVIQLVRLNFGAVSGNDPLSDVLAHLASLVLLVRLGLNLLVLVVLSFLSLVSVSLVVAEGGNWPSNPFNNDWRDPPDRRFASDWRTFNVATSSVVVRMALKMSSKTVVGIDNSLVRPTSVVGAASAVVLTVARQ